MMRSLNILIVGAGMYVCGRGTDAYGTVIPAVYEWRRNNGLGEVYIVGNSPEGLAIARDKSNELQRKMNMKVAVTYFSHSSRKDSQCYREAIRKISRPACAIVVVPDNLHKEIAAATIEGGLHTLVVKPLASTLKDAYELTELQQKKRVYCAVEFHKRLDHANLKLKDTIAQGVIGKPLYFLVEYSQRKSIPAERFKKWIRSTNVFQYLGIHYVDIIYFATKAIPQRAMAIGQRGWLVSKGVDAYDSIQGIVEWRMPSGEKFSSHILTNWIDPETTSAMSYQKIKVIGTKGRFESDQKRRGITIVSDESGMEEPNPYFCMPYGEDGNVSYYGYGIESIHQFLDDVMRIEEGILTAEQLEDVRPTFKKALVSTAVLEAVNKSLDKDGEWVSIQSLIG